MRNPERQSRNTHSFFRAGCPCRISLPGPRWALLVGRCCNAPWAFPAALLDMGLCSRHKSCCRSVYLLGKQAERAASQCGSTLRLNSSWTFGNISRINVTMKIQQLKFRKCSSLLKRVKHFSFFLEKWALWLTQQSSNQLAAGRAG